MSRVADAVRRDGLRVRRHDAEWRILLVDVDPYLAHLVRQRFPERSATAVPPDADVTEVLRATSDPTLVLVDTASPRLGRLLLHRDSVRIVATATAGDHPWVTADLDAVLVRPFTADEVEDTLERVIGAPTGHSPEAPTQRWVATARARIPLYHLAALAAAAPLELSQGGPGRVLLLTTLVAITLLRIFRHRPDLLSSLDVAVATTALVLTGGPASSYVPLALVVAVASGLHGSLWNAIVSGAVLGASAIVVPGGWDRPSQLTSLLSYVAVFPAIAVTTAQSVRLAQLRAPDLTASRRIRDGLVELRQRARVGGAQLTVEDAADAVLSDARGAGARAAVVLVGASTGYVEVASTGLPPHPELSLAPWQVPDERAVRLHVIPPDLQSGGTGLLCWYQLGLADGGPPRGVLLVGLPVEDQLDPEDAELLSRRSALTIETAHSLALLRELIADRERLSLATLVEEEVAQTLVHVRMELEYLHGDLATDAPDHQADVARLVTVLQRSLAEVRVAVADLRTTGTPAGLDAALRQYGRDIARSGGPDISLHSRTRLRLGPEQERDVFAITRLAVAEAQRHAGVSRVTVTLDEVDGRLRVSVEDDGLPVGDAMPGGNTTAMRGLRARAVSIGAELRGLQTPERGCRIELLCPAMDGFVGAP